MKKKIVSLVLALVMVVLTLVSCGAPSIVSRDLTEFATFKFDEFKADLQKIVIEDGAYTNNVEWREGLVTEKIFSSISTAVIKADKKLYSGTIGENDVAYYCYYTSYTDGDKVYYFNFDQMNEDTVTASGTKANHVIENSQVTPNDDDYNFKKALKAALSGLKFDQAYDMDATKDTVVSVNGDEAVTVVISYTRSYKGADDKTVTETALYEELVLSEANKAVSPLVAKLLSEGSVLKVNNKVTVKKTTGEGDSATTEDVSTFEVVDGEVTYTYENVQIKWIVKDQGDGSVTFKYTPYTAKTEVEPSNLHTKDQKIDLKDKELTYHVFPVYFYEVPAISADSIIKYVLADKVALTDFEVFEDEAYKNGDMTVKALIEELKEMYTLKSSTSKKFSDASEALKKYTYITMLSKLQAEDYTAADSITDNADKNLLTKLGHFSQLKNVEKATLTDAEKAALNAALAYMADLEDEDVKNVLDLAAEAEAKRKIVTEAGDAATDAQKQAATLAETEYKTAALKLYKDQKDAAYKDVLDAAFDKKIAEITAAKNDAAEEGKKTVAEIVKSEKIDSTTHELDSAYRNHVADAVAAEVWKLIDKYVTVSAYPEDILKEYTEHLYESYEYDFYKGDKDSKQSNYAYYKGDLEAFLIDTMVTKKFIAEGEKDYMKGIEAEAKTFIAPIIKVFVVAKAFEEEGAQEKLAAYVEKDIAAGVYDAHYKNDDELSADENAKAKKEAEDAAKETVEAVREDAKHFLVTDEVYDLFKKEQGSSYKNLEESYGEQNLRTALQFNKLFDYLVGTESLVAEHDGDWHNEPKTNLDGKTGADLEGIKTVEILFNNPLIKYTVK